jgi:hypothetical protein
MSGNNFNRIFLARLAGTAVFDPNGDPVGKVRDAVATLRSNNQSPRILGLVVEVPLRRRVFVPITRVTSIESGAVVITGLLNMRRFETRTGELMVLGDLLDRSITLLDSDEQVLVEDMAMEENRTGDWLITKVHIMRKGRGLRRKGATSTVAWEEVTGFAHNESNQGVTNLLSTMETFALLILQPFCKILLRSDALKLREHSMTNASPTFLKRWMSPSELPFLQNLKESVLQIFSKRWILMMRQICSAKSVRSEHKSSLT